MNSSENDPWSFNEFEAEGWNVREACSTMIGMVNSSLPFNCLVSWLHQSSGGGSDKLYSAWKIYNFFANNCRKWYQLFPLSPLLADFIKGEMYQNKLLHHSSTKVVHFQVLFESHAIFEKNRPLWLPIPKTLHLKSVCISKMKHVAQWRNSSKGVS